MTALPDFIAYGLCAQTDPEAFFPDKGFWTTTRAAKAVCARCPVLDDCRDYALAHPEVEGIWGATTDRDRQRIRKARAATTEGEAA